MEVLINERRIQQGEDWNLDILLSQSETSYIPYIIGKRENPHFVMTVASTKFEKTNRFAESYWCQIDTDPAHHALGSTPMFEQTVPYEISTVLSSIPTTKNDLISVDSSIADHTPLQCLYKYKVVNDTDTTRLGYPYHYCYFYGTTNIIVNDEYELRVRFNINSYLDGHRLTGTSTWGAQNYMYQITLVSGQEMLNTILDAKDLYPGLDWRKDWPSLLPSNTYESRVATWLEQDDIKHNVFDFIKLRKPGYFQPDIDWDSPLGQIWVPEPILKPTKLQVDNNLKIII